VELLPVALAGELAQLLPEALDSVVLHARIIKEFLGFA